MDDRARRKRALELWLDGQLDDGAIAAAVGVEESSGGAAEVARWREEEGWEGIRELLRIRMAAERDAQASGADARLVQIAAVIESFATKLLARGMTALKPSDLKTLAGTLEIVQKIRRAADISDRSRRISQ